MLRGRTGVGDALIGRRQAALANPLRGLYPRVLCAGCLDLLLSDARGRYLPFSALAGARGGGPDPDPVHLHDHSPRSRLIRLAQMSSAAYVVLHGQVKRRTRYKIAPSFSALDSPQGLAIQPESDMAWEPVYGENMPLRKIGGRRDGLTDLLILSAKVHELTGAMATGIRDLGHVDFSVVRPLALRPQQNDWLPSRSAVGPEPNRPSSVGLVKVVGEAATYITIGSLIMTDDLQGPVVNLDRLQCPLPA